MCGIRQSPKTDGLVDTKLKITCYARFPIHIVVNSCYISRENLSYARNSQGGSTRDQGATAPTKSMTPTGLNKIYS